MLLNYPRKRRAYINFLSFLPVCFAIHTGAMVKIPYKGTRPPNPQQEASGGDDNIQPAEPIEVTPGKYKSLICKYFMRGYCKLDHQCKYAHGWEELEAPPRHPKYNTKACRYFPKGLCKQGKLCNFRHDHHDRESLSSETEASSQTSKYQDRERADNRENGLNHETSFASSPQLLSASAYSSFGPTTESKKKVTSQVNESTDSIVESQNPDRKLASQPQAKQEEGLKDVISNKVTKPARLPQKPLLIDSDNYKTELCKTFTKHQFCNYGITCQFAHGEEELQFRKRHDYYKTKYCTTYWAGQMCRYGNRCHFIHDLSENLSDQPIIPLPSGLEKGFSETGLETSFQKRLQISERTSKESSSLPFYGSKYPHMPVEPILSHFSNDTGRYSEHQKKVEWNSGQSFNFSMYSQMRLFIDSQVYSYFKHQMLYLSVDDLMLKQLHSLSDYYQSTGNINDLADAFMMNAIVSGISFQYYYNNKEYLGYIKNFHIKQNYLDMNDHHRLVVSAFQMVCLGWIDIYINPNEKKLLLYDIFTQEVSMPPEYPINNWHWIQAYNIHFFIMESLKIIESNHNSEIEGNFEESVNKLITTSCQQGVLPYMHDSHNYQHYALNLIHNINRKREQLAVHPTIPETAKRFRN